MTKIAVYGTLRRGFGNYQYFLSDQTFLGQETVKLPMEMISLGGFPGLVEVNKTTDVVIEIFEVDEETFRSVDGLESYPRFYDRTQIKTSFGKSWIYFLADKTDYDNQIIVSNGDWKEYLTTKNVKHEIFPEN